MSPEEQRIVIAKACGWKRSTVMLEQSDFYGTPISTEAWFPPDKRRWDALQPPGYLNDLNACAEMEKELPEKSKMRTEYLVFLAKLTNGQPAFASAAKRAEAFLRTIGKWRDE